MLLSAGHCCVDMYSSALGALQPFLADQLKLTLTQAGFLGGALVLSSYMMQPVFGFLADRMRTRLFAALGPLIAGVCISSLGLAPGYSALVLLACLGGLGMAMFHPQASAWATVNVAEKRGNSMGIFISSGALGFSLGPTVFASITAAVGLSRLWIAASAGVLITALLLFTLEPPGGRDDAPRGFHFEALRPVARPLVLLFLLVFIRSVVQVTYSHLIPLYLHVERGFSVTRANYVASMYLAAGAVGGLLGGTLADRFGGKRIIQFSMVASVPFLLLFFWATSVWSIVGIVLGGFVLLFTIPVNVVMAQDLAPGETSTISALMMGFAWGCAGLIFVPLTGWVADHSSMHTALMALAFFPWLGYFLARMLPGR